MDISFRSDEALYLQIADHFRRLVAAGKLRPGERLPAIRELAQKLGIDPGTVARAYQELERDGVVTGRRGGGSFVSTVASEAYLSELQHRRLSTLVEGAIIEALGLGFGTEDIETAFTLRLADWRERRSESAQPVSPAARAPGEVRFIGSHDLAVELLATHFGALYPDLRFTASFVGSLAGLMALESREADIAGAHLMDAETGEYNVPYVRRLMPHEVVVLINLVQRVQGLMLPHGNPKGITGVADLKSPDVTFVNLEYRSQAIAHVELSWLAPSKLRRTTVVGSKKMVVYDDCSNEPVRVYDSGVMPRNPESFGEYLKYRTGDIVSPHIDPSEPIAMQMEDFCRAVRSGSTPRSSAHLGLQVVHMIEAAERSLKLCNRCADSTAVTQAGFPGAGA